MKFRSLIFVISISVIILIVVIFSFDFSNSIFIGNREEIQRIIIISVDTLRADSLGCYGYDRNTSPNIDEFAGDAVVFRNARSPSPWTLPSHMSIFTGLYPLNHGVLQRKNTVKNSVPWLTDILKNAGFFTAGFAGGAYLDSEYGFDRGFDTYDSRRVQYLRRDSSEGLSISEDVLESGKSVLKEHQDQNVFLFLHTYQVHDYGYIDDLTYIEPALHSEYGDLNPAKEANRLRQNGVSTEDKKFVEYSRQRYDSALHQLDSRMGKFFGWLKENDLMSNSLIILTSDHGEEFDDHGRAGHGVTLYEESIRVPLIMRFPAGWHTPEVVSQNVSLVDLVPTIIEILNLEPQDTDGISLMPILGSRVPKRGSPPQDRGGRAIVLEVDEHFRGFALLSGSKKLYFRPEGGMAPGIRDLHLPTGWEFYDLDQDPDEKRNLCEGSGTDCGPPEAREFLAKREAISEAVRSNASAEDVSAKVIEDLRALGYIQ